MKKILALALSLMMLLSCTSVLAEAVYFDPAVTEVVPGEFVALDGIGLMFYLPATMQAMEPTEDDIAGGGLAGFLLRSLQRDHRCDDQLHHGLRRVRKNFKKFPKVVSAVLMRGIMILRWPIVRKMVKK